MNDKQQLMALGEEWGLCMATRLDEALRQRDELRAALDALVTIVADTRRPAPDDVYATIAEARALVSRYSAL